MKKPAWLIIAATTFGLVFTEFILAYYEQQKNGWSPLLWRLTQRAYYRVVRSSQKDYVRIDTEQDNPFSHPYRIKDTMKYHPFIDYTGVHGFYPDKIKHDYFGFRNDKDYYFERPEGPLVVMTGGSEAAGSTHRRTIAETIRLLLHQRTNKTYTVLNLAMNSYSVANEMNAYLHLAYHLKPEIVISHSGWNDLFSANMVPERFKQLGLNFIVNQRWWLPKLYKNREVVELRWPLNEKGYDGVVDVYLRNVEKYRSLVEGNGGHFIAGIQPYNPHCREGDERDEIYENISEKYKELLAKTADKEFIPFPYLTGIKFFDCVHTYDTGAYLTALAYAETISHLDQ